MKTGMKWTLFFRPVAKEDFACSTLVRSRKDEEANEAQPGIQGEGGPGGVARAGDDRAASEIGATAQGSSERGWSGTTSGSASFARMFRGHSRPRGATAMLQGARTSSGSEEDRGTDGRAGFFSGRARSTPMKVRRLDQPSRAASPPHWHTGRGVNTINALSQNRAPLQPLPAGWSWRRRRPT